METSVANEAPKATITAEDYKKDLDFIEEVTSNVDEVQCRALAEILSQNAHVEYLQRYNLNGRTDRETFKKVVPVITYEDIQPDINRIAYGDKSPILCSQPISELLSSSGTSGGESKLIPTTEGELERRLQLHKLLMSVLSQVAPDFGKGKGMYFMFISPEQKTPGGLVARFLTTSFYNSPHFNYSRLHYPHFNYTSPTAAILPRLLPKHVLPNALWSLPKPTSFPVREAVMEVLKPDPTLADFIEVECSKESWQGIVTRLWPNTKYVDAVVTGSMSQYIPILDYYSNNLPLISTVYASSESHFGINLNPFCKPSEVSYTLIPTICYFEFLPYHGNSGVIDSISMPQSLDEKEQQQLVDLADVKIGQEYELVVTTYSGLYRYRVGDVLRVAGYKNKAPQFNFLCRENVILSIGADFTNEVELQNAMKNAVGNLMSFDAQVTEYTSYVDITTIPSHYVLFWELSVNDSTPVPPSVIEDCCLTIEESLNYFYREGRASNKSIGPLEIRVVEIGTFDKLMDYCISLGSSMNQYKTPRCVKYAPLIELLNSRVVSSYFSPMCPKWVPGYKKWNNTN
ncbi:indole-3-acetic acid-amido synthetase gh3.6 [Nicotiana attenuata]|uniref:Indole-3-acetic acid-amido synthetase gh3.6 n=1 Tax=Nicotiana attenuata TaxID=49451 RepID=A0A1J6IGI4_NICAT|nr:indole-3-acetic acid-amido synthetase gh3.6 [Nicotiana attenuata]